MVETINNKEVIDVIPTMFFTVSVATQKRPIHMLVKAESALAALEYVSKNEKAPILGVNITEYTKFHDATVEPTVEVGEVAEQEIQVEQEGGE